MKSHTAILTERGVCYILDDVPTAGLFDFNDPDEAASFESQLKKSIDNKVRCDDQQLVQSKLPDEAFSHEGRRGGILDRIYFIEFTELIEKPVKATYKSKLFDRVLEKVPQSVKDHVDKVVNEDWKEAWVKKDKDLHDHIAESNKIIQQKDARILELETRLKSHEHPF